MKDRLSPDLLRALCHDLRGPLGAIGNWLHVLNSMNADEAARARALGGIGRDLRAMGALVEQLSTLATLEADPPTEPQVVDLTPFLKDLVEAAAKASGHPVALNVSGPPLRVIASAVRLREMLWLFVASAPGSPDRTESLSVLSDETMVDCVVETRRPRPLTVALARALAETQGGELVETPGSDTRILRLRLRRAN